MLGIHIVREGLIAVTIGRIGVMKKADFMKIDGE